LKKLTEKISINMDKIGRLYYWTHTKNGPKLGAIIYPEKVIRLDFTTHEAITKISKADAMSAVATAIKSNDGWSAEYIGPRGNTRWVSGKSLPEVARKVRIQKTNDFTEENTIKNDPVLHLERELSCHDWYYAFSDDHSVWLGGEAHSKLIQKLIKLVPVEKAKELWAKYAPEDVVYN
jgi:hypothetical protein